MAGLVLDGFSWAETADHASLDITGTPDLRVAVAMDDWTPATGGFGQVGVSKWSTNNQSYGVQVLDSGSGSSGRLHGFIDNNGSGASDGYTSTVSPTVSDGAILAYRAVLEGSISRCTFYTKATTAANALADCESDSGWTQLGTAITDLGFTGIFSGTSPLRVGALETSGAIAQLLRGTVYAVVVKDGIDGTTVANPDFYTNTLPFTDGSGRSWSYLTTHISVGVAEETDEAVPIQSISAGGDDLVFVGVASETDEALPLLSVSTAPTIRSYPWAGTLGCGTWTVQIARRGGSPVELEVAASSVRMDRRGDDVSGASVSFLNSDVPDWCVGALANLRQWRYEVRLLRDGEEAWVGIISDRIRFTHSTTSFDARDLFAMMERRVLPSDRTFNDLDVSVIFQSLVEDALSVDPTPVILFDTQLSGIRFDKSIVATEYIRAADALRDLAQVGVDFTMVGRTLRIRGPGAGRTLANPLLDEHVVGEPSADLDGLNAASQWIVKGADATASAAAGGIDPDIGLVQQVYEDQDITRHEDALAAAEELLAASGTSPLEIACTLGPDAPFAFNELIPGDFIQTYLTFGRFAVAEPLMISSVTAEVSGRSERVGLSLVRPAATDLEVA